MKALTYATTGRYAGLYEGNIILVASLATAANSEGGIADPDAAAFTAFGAFIQVGLISVPAFFRGAAGLSPQLLWTRRLVDILGAMREAFARVMGVFFLGGALRGNYQGFPAWVSDRLREPAFVPSPTGMDDGLRRGLVPMARPSRPLGSGAAEGWNRGPAVIHGRVSVRPRFSPSSKGLSFVGMTIASEGEPPFPGSAWPRSRGSRGSRGSNPLTRLPPGVAFPSSPKKPWAPPLSA